MGTPVEKMDVYRLVKDELIFELRVRGVEEVEGVKEMRKVLSVLLKRERQNVSLTYPAHPYSYQEDITALTLKIGETKKLIEECPPGSLTPDKQIQGKIAHALGRCERITLANDGEQRGKGKILGEILLLSALWRDKKKRNKSLPMASSTLLFGGAVQDNAEDAETSDTSEEDVAPARRVIGRTESTPRFRAVPVSQWNLQFSGEHKEQSVAAFLERVDELREARHVSKEELFSSAIDLFHGKALLWYRTTRKMYATWDELAKGLRADFQAPDYDETLYEDIKNRTQGAKETMHMYVLLMLSLFDRLVTKLPEAHKLTIIRRNLAPEYQKHLGMTDIPSIVELKEISRRLDRNRSLVEGYIPPPARTRTGEPHLAYIDDTEVTVSCSAVRPVVCFNCSQEGHMRSQCREPFRKRCYRCQAPNYTVHTCPKCSGNGPQSADKVG